MSKRDELLLLNDILTASNKIERFTEGLNFDQFMDDERTQDACIRNFEIIGEAANYISEQTRFLYPKVEWRKITNYRNLLIHAYFGVNLEIVWDIIKNNLPGTIYLIKKIIDDTGK